MRGWKKKKEYNVTFMIGNGFDLNLELPTLYTDFYAYYISPENCQNDSLLIQKMKSKILENNFENWSDLELTMGEYTSQLANFDECNQCFQDITLNLEEYLHKKCSLTENLNVQRVREISKELPEKIAEAFYVNRNYHKMFDQVNKKQRYTNIRVINFNFTDHVNNLLCSYFDQFNHKFHGKNMSSVKSNTIKIGNECFHTQIHGKLGRNTIIAVDHVDQLAIYKEGRISREEAELFTKKKLNAHAERYWNTEFCMEQLKNCDIIFIYGMSFGATDKIWWDAVMKCLESPNVNLVIDDFCKPKTYSMRGSQQCYEDTQFQKFRLDSRRNILKRLSPDKDVSDSINERIHIIQNSGIFSYIPSCLQEQLLEKDWETWK